MIDSAAGPHVSAPSGALAWSPAKGFVFDAIERDALVNEGGVVLNVVDGVVSDVGGYGPLVAVVRLESEIVSLRWRLLDIASHAADSLAAR